MSEVAKFKLITSNGVVLAGDPVPGGLSEKELDAIREAGGLEGTPAKKGKSKTGKGGSGADTSAAIAAAEQKVLDAQAAVTAAGTDTVALDKAEEELAEAEAELIALKG